MLIAMRNKIPKSDFGERLRQIRREKGMTQAQLSEISGISRRMLVHYESVVKMPPVEKVKNIARALGVSSDELLGMPTPTKDQKNNEKASYRIMKRVRLIEKLPKRDQDMILNLINTLIENNKSRGKLK
jgi:transcriptional regulator with XRE-family HTH domain